MLKIEHGAENQRDADRNQRKSRDRTELRLKHRQNALSRKPSPVDEANERCGHKYQTQR